MSPLLEWRINVTDMLHSRQLGGWITPMDDGGLETVAGDEPDRTDKAKWKAWADKYVYIQQAMEMCLGPLRIPITNDPRYQQVPRWHPIMARYYLVETLIRDQPQTSLMVSNSPWSQTFNVDDDIAYSVRIHSYADLYWSWLRSS